MLYLSFLWFLPNQLFFGWVVSAVTRNIQFFGFESQQKMSASYVVVIGLGGVGSHAASMLLRSGIGKLLLVDFDQVLLSLILLLIMFNFYSFILGWLLCFLWIFPAWFCRFQTLKVTLTVFYLSI